MNKELYSMLRGAIKILSDIGYNQVEIKEIKLNNRLSATRGCYYNDTKTIEISGRHFKYDDNKEVMNTIIHELCHNIHDLKYGDTYINDGHDEEWFRIAKDVSDKTPYKIEQYYMGEGDYQNIPKEEYFKHIFKCKACGYIQYSVSKSKDTKKLARRKKCLRCKCEVGTDGEFECVNTMRSHWKYII